MTTTLIAAPEERRLQRVRYELQRREVTVVEARQISSNFISLCFAGEGLKGFTSASFDDHIKLIFNDVTGNSVMRDYTPRVFDGELGQLHLEFALHPRGPAADWARAAQVGTQAVIAGPKGSLIIPMNYDWHLLVGDASALPAIARRLEQLPAACRAIVRVQVDAMDDRRELHSRADVDLQWYATTAEWLAGVAATPLPPGEGFVWCAGESAAVYALREDLLVRRQHPREASKIAAYWKRGTADFHEKL